jgi:hypothetical protein
MRMLVRRQERGGANRILLGSLFAFSSLRGGLRFALALAATVLLLFPGSAFA